MNIKRSVLIFSLLIFIGTNNFAQDELNQPNMRFYLSDDEYEWTESKGQFILQT
jgi:hypothetical protein